MQLDRENLLRAVDPDGAVEFLAELVRFRSVSGTSGEAGMARLLADRMAGIGLEVDLQSVGGDRLNAVGSWRGSGGGRSLVLNGHVDTNPVGEGWTVDPWGGAVDGKFIYGIGVSNAKAGDAAFFWAVKTLIDQGVRLRGDVKLAYVAGELQGGVGTLKALDAGLRADAFIVCEPTGLAALTMHAGSLGFVIELRGATRHLSKREEAVDALAAACSLAPRINGATWSGAANDEHRALNRGHVGVMRAGLGDELRETRPPQVADVARLAGSARYAPSQSEMSVLADLRCMLDELEREFPGLAARVTPEPRPDGMPAALPFEVPRDAPVVQALNRAYEHVRGAPQPTGAVAPACLYWTDASHLAHRGGMSGVVCGPGGRYNTMPDERVDLADYLDAVALYLLTVLDWCS